MEKRKTSLYSFWSNNYFNASPSSQTWNTIVFPRKTAVGCKIISVCPSTVALVCEFYMLGCHLFWKRKAEESIPSSLNATTAAFGLSSDGCNWLQSQAYFISRPKMDSTPVFVNSKMNDPAVFPLAFSFQRSSTGHRNSSVDLTLHECGAFIRKTQPRRGGSRSFPVQL